MITSLGPVALPMSFLIGKIEEQFADMGFPLTSVYDPALTFETTETRRRIHRASMKLPKGSAGRAYPLLGFNRTVLTSSILSERGKQKAEEFGATRDDDLDYYTVHGTFTLGFILFESRLQNLELMETAYMSRGIMTNLRRLEIEIPPLGTFVFQLDWHPLESFQVNNDQAEWHALTGSVDISGVFVVVEKASGPYINNLIVEFTNWAQTAMYYRVTANMDTGVITEEDNPPIS